MAEQTDGCQRELPDTRPRMIKASIRKADTDAWKQKVGRAIHRAMHLVGWSLKELAAHADRDERQVSRWLAGTERAQIDVLMAVEALRWPLMLSLAELDDKNEVETTIRRRA